MALGPVRRYAATVKRVLILGAIVPALAACGTRPPRAQEGERRAVVLYPLELSDAGHAVARALEKVDYDVILKSTPIPRERSSVAVYGIRDNPSRVDEMKRLADDLGEGVEFLPFQQRATGGNAVVVWLGSGRAPD